MTSFLNTAVSICARAAALGAVLGALGLAVPANAATPSAKQVRGPIWISVPASAGALQSIQVKVPGAGNMVVTVTGTVNYEHTQGVQGSYCLQLSNSASYVGGCTPMAGSDLAVRAWVAAGMPTTVSGFGASEQYSIVRSYPVTAGSTYTYYLNGYGSGFDGLWLFQPSITAVYVPGTMP